MQINRELPEQFVLFLILLFVVGRIFAFVALFIVAVASAESHTRVWPSATQSKNAVYSNLALGADYTD